MLKGSLDESYHVNMLIELLVRFPEIYTITYNMNASACCISYMIKGPIEQKPLSDLRRQLKQNLDALYFLHNHGEPDKFKITGSRYHNLTQIQINMEGGSLLGESVSLITKTVQGFFGEDLISEISAEYDGSLAAIAEPFEELPGRSPAVTPARKISHLFAFREAGKVYIYDK